MTDKLQMWGGICELNSYSVVVKGKKNSVTMGCTSSSWTDVHEVQLNETLTERQIQLIRDTWDLISDDMEGTGLIIFRRWVLVISVLIKYIFLEKSLFSQVIHMLEINEFNFFLLTWNSLLNVVCPVNDNAVQPYLSGPYLSGYSL